MKKLVVIFLLIASAVSAQWQPFDFYNAKKQTGINYQYHAETLDWKSRVIARGGNVDTLQLRILDNFVKRIYNAGLRSYFVRMNPFYGSDLTAAYIPLFRDTSLKVTYLGFANDSNYNFVAANYTDTTGLGDASNTNKYFNTGVNPYNIALLGVNNYGQMWFQFDGGVASGLPMGSYTGAYTRCYSFPYTFGSMIYNAVMISYEASATLVAGYNPVGLWHHQKTGTPQQVQILHNGTQRLLNSSYSDATSKPNTNIYVFGWSNNGTFGNAFQKRMMGYAITKTMTNALADSLNTIWGNFAAYRYLKDNTKLIIDGNSMTYGTASVNFGLQFSWNTGYSNFVGMGLPGATINGLNSRYTSTIAPLYDNAKRKNILCIWEFCNAALAGSDSAVILTQFREYYQKAKATGFKVVLLTALPFYPPAGYEGNDALYETRRLQVNTAWRNNPQLYCDALCDIASDTRLGDKGDENNTTYRNPDKIHMNERGDHIIMTYFSNAVIKTN